MSNRRDYMYHICILVLTFSQIISGFENVNESKVPMRIDFNKSKVPENCTLVEPCGCAYPTKIQEYLDYYRDFNGTIDLGNKTVKNEFKNWINSITELLGYKDTGSIVNTTMNGTVYYEYIDMHIINPYLTYIIYAEDAPTIRTWIPAYYIPYTKNNDGMCDFHFVYNYCNSTSDTGVVTLANYFNILEYTYVYIWDVSSVLDIIGVECTATPPISRNDPIIPIVIFIIATVIVVTTLIVLMIVYGRQIRRHTYYELT